MVYLDHWNLIQILSLAIIGTIIIFTISPSVAENKGYEELHFFKNHILYMFFAFVSILFVLLSVLLFVLICSSFTTCVELFIIIGYEKRICDELLF